MPIDKTPHHRRSIRKKACDYSAQGLYFVTICTENKECIFGHIINGEMKLNSLGKLVHNKVLEIPKYVQRAVIHEFIVMPNHIHMIIQLKELNAEPTGTQLNADAVGAQKCAPTSGRPKFGEKLSTIAYIVRGFKARASKLAGFNLWQRNYYEHIIRTDSEYGEIAFYTINNPKTWDADKLHKKSVAEFLKKLDT
jgi:REP element-mobilizing transposase RayT